MIPRNAAIGAAVLALAGLGAVAYYSSTARASQPASVAPATAVPGTYLDPVAAAPAAVAVPVATAPVGERVVYRTRTAAAPRYYVHKRSKKHSAMIIGGSAVGGAGIGALVGGKKGALIGWLVGGAGGTIYDRKTHKKVEQQ